MYANIIISSMEKAIKKTYKRRKIQLNYNKKHNIVPKTISKKIADVIKISNNSKILDSNKKSKRSAKIEIARLKLKMKKAAKGLKFEYVIDLRNRIARLENNTSK